MVISWIITIILYLTCIFFLKTLINIKIIDKYFGLNVIFVCLLSWAPLHLLRILMKKYDPTENEKIMKRKSLNKKI